MTRLGAVLVAALIAASVPAVEVSAHRAPNSCGHQKKQGAGWYRAYGHNVTCKKTRTVARRWTRKCSLEFCRENQAVKIYVWPGYTCRHEQRGYESVRVKCTAEGDRLVHFMWGS